MVQLNKTDTIWFQHKKVYLINIETRTNVHVRGN